MGVLFGMIISGEEFSVLGDFLLINFCCPSFDCLEKKCMILRFCLGVVEFGVLFCGASYMFSCVFLTNI